MIKIWSNIEKIQLLYDLVYALQQAKLLYGFQHNDIYYGNIRVKPNILIDFGFSTIDENMDDKNRKTFKGKDLLSFNQLVDYMGLPYKSVIKLQSKNILYDTLLDKMLLLFEI